MTGQEENYNPMINQIRHDKLLLMVEKLDGMLVKHVEWLSLLHKVILCKLPFSNALLWDHRTCDFGEWYYSMTNPAVIETPDFIHLGRLHESLHMAANIMLKQYENNVITGAKEYESFVEVEKDFFESLNNFINNVLSTKSHFDHLTNIPNRNLVTLILEKEYSKIKRNNGDCFVVFADLDNFKQVNDTYGHAVGDRVLTEVSKCFSTNIRPYDTVGRYGGDEFIFCLPETDLKNAKRILERVRSGIEELCISTDEPNAIKITCSFGTSKMSTDKSLVDVIKQADEALYIAKKDGRNRMKVWSDSVAK